MSSRAELVDGLREAMRENSGRALMLHGAIAERFGLNFTDLKCLDLARSEAELTAGRIAEATGLSTSAVTTVLDRLERRGFINRHRDATDRRKVLVRSTGRHEAEVAEIFGVMSTGFDAILADYSDEQLAFLGEVMARFNDTARTFTAALTATRPSAHPD